VRLAVAEVAGWARLRELNIRPVPASSYKLLRVPITLDQAVGSRLPEEYGEGRPSPSERWAHLHHLLIVSVALLIRGWGRLRSFRHWRGPLTVNGGLTGLPYDCQQRPYS
jgi:hypothetical protein